MGTADAVPGVSGGTIALILGIYDDFIGALGNILAVVRTPTQPAAWRSCSAGLRIILPLGICLLAALFIASKILVGTGIHAAKDACNNDLAAVAVYVQDHPPSGLLMNPHTAPLVFAFFFGLVFMSLSEPWKQRSTSKSSDWLLAGFAACLTAWISLSPATGGSSHPAALVGAGALAIMVMLLPGISGSLALLILGMYQPIVAAVHNRELGTLTYVAIGAVLGAALFIPLLKRLLAIAHDRTMATLSGLMAGSLVALWPWKAHYIPELIGEIGPMQPQAPFGSWWWCICCAALGAGIILLGAVVSKKSTIHT